MKRIPIHRAALIAAIALAAAVGAGAVQRHALRPARRERRQSKAAEQHQPRSGASTTAT